MGSVDGNLISYSCDVEHFKHISVNEVFSYVGLLSMIIITIVIIICIMKVCLMSCSYRSYNRV